MKAHKSIEQKIQIINKIDQLKDNSTLTLACKKMNTRLSDYYRFKKEIVNAQNKQNVKVIAYSGKRPYKTRSKNNGSLGNDDKIAIMFVTKTQALELMKEWR